MSSSPRFEECLLVPYTAAEVRAETLLVLAPHPDDEVLGCGGLSALVAKAGGRVVPVLVTDGGAGDFSGSGDAAAYVATRLAESTRAASTAIGALDVVGLVMDPKPDCRRVP